MNNKVLNRVFTELRHKNLNEASKPKELDWEPDTSNPGIFQPNDPEEDKTEKEPNRDLLQFKRDKLEQGAGSEDELSGSKFLGALMKAVDDYSKKQNLDFGNMLSDFPVAPFRRSKKSLSQVTKEYKKTIDKQIANYKTPSYVTTRSKVMNPSRFNKPGRRN